MSTEVTTEALRGPWQAILAAGGDVIDLDDAYYILDDLRIEIVRGTAAPDNEGRLPGTFISHDLLTEFADFEEPEDVDARWAQAQAMVAGLNAAGAEVTR